MRCGLRHGQLPNAAARVGLGIERRDEEFDLALLAVRRPIEEVVDVLGRQMCRQRRDGRQRHIAATRRSKDDRKPTHDAGRFDAPIRGRLGQAQHVGRIREERRVAFVEIETSPIDFGERRDQRDHRLPFARRQALDLGEQLPIRKVPKIRV